jgi:hypothetical protein
MILPPNDQGISIVTFDQGYEPSFFIYMASSFSLNLTLGIGEWISVEIRHGTGA